jgi:acyl carrier protein
MSSVFTMATRSDNTQRKGRGWWGTPAAADIDFAARRNVAAIRSWLIEAVAADAKIAPEDIDPAQPITVYGLDSRSAIALSGALEEWLGTELSPTLVWDYPSIDAIAQHLATGNEDAGEARASGRSPEGSSSTLA